MACVRFSKVRFWNVRFFTLSDYQMGDDETSDYEMSYSRIIQYFNCWKNFYDEKRIRSSIVSRNREHLTVYCDSIYADTDHSNVVLNWMTKTECRGLRFNFFALFITNWDQNIAENANFPLFCNFMRPTFTESAERLSFCFDSVLRPHWLVKSRQITKVSVVLRLHNDL